MNSTNSSMCVRCGKKRIVLSVAEETIGTSKITTTETICPDPDCQKKVDVLLAGEKHKRDVSIREKQARDAARKFGRKTDIKLN